MSLQLTQEEIALMDVFAAASLTGVNARHCINPPDNADIAFRNALAMIEQRREILAEHAAPVFESKPDHCEAYHRKAWGGLSWEGKRQDNCEHPEPAIKESLTAQLPEGVVPPPAGWAYFGRGPLINFASGDHRKDVAVWFSTVRRWETQVLFSGNGCDHYALRIGSDIAKANGIGGGE
jgi:hypothetical protein